MKYFLADRIAMIVATAFIFASIWFGTGFFHDWRRFHDVPVALDVASAVRMAKEGRQWISVVPGRWRCDKAIQRGISTLVPAWSPDGTGILVAEFQYPVDCDSVVGSPVAGIVYAMPEYLSTDLAARRLLGPADHSVHLLNVSDQNEREDVRLGAILSCLGIVFAFALFPLRRLFGGFHARNRERLRVAAFAPEGSIDANRAVQRHGALLVGITIFCFVICQGWVIGGFIPVRWFAIAGGVLGSAMIAFPAQYRRLYRKGWRGK